MEERKRNAKETVTMLAKYFLLTMALSLLGWAYETAFMYFTTGHYCERGFMTMPFCPIYGVSLMTVYFLVGLPQDHGRGILKKIRVDWARYLLYFLVAFLVPTVAELIVGIFFETLYGVQLWSYAGVPLNLGGYVSLPVSLFWGVAILFVMRFVFPILKKWIFKIPDALACALAVVLFVAVAVDVAFNYSQL